MYMSYNKFSHLHGYIFIFHFESLAGKEIMDGSRTDAKLNKGKHISVCMCIHIQYVWCFIQTASAVFSS